MTALAKLTQLRDILQDMYPTIGRAQLIVDTAGLPRNRIAWSAAAQENWHAILSEAHHQRMVPALVDVAKVDFPKRAADLDHALAVYEDLPAPLLPAISLHSRQCRLRTRRTRNRRSLGNRAQTLLPCAKSL
jgi:hypothetical protein